MPAADNLWNAIELHLWWCYQEVSLIMKLDLNNTTAMNTKSPTFYSSMQVSFSLNYITPQTPPSNLHILHGGPYSNTVSRTNISPWM